METLNHLWSPAPKDLILADNEVHVWRAQLELPSSQVQRLRGSLTDDELDRANRFSFEIDRQRFIAARGTLRSILSRYITISPGHLRFYYNQYGKPFLAPEFSSYLLNFNLSHSGSMALYSITRNMEIGVDVERVRFDFEYEEIAKRFFFRSTRWPSCVQYQPKRSLKLSITVGPARKRTSRLTGKVCHCLWTVSMFPLRPGNHLCC